MLRFGQREIHPHPANNDSQEGAKPHRNFKIYFSIELPR